MFKYYVSIAFYFGIIVSVEIGNLEIQKTLFAQYLGWSSITPNSLCLFPMFCACSIRTKKKKTVGGPKILRESYLVKTS